MIPLGILFKMSERSIVLVSTILFAFKKGEKRNDEDGDIKRGKNTGW
jgi:hypothetical protein